MFFLVGGRGGKNVHMFVQNAPKKTRQFTMIFVSWSEKHWKFGNFETFLLLWIFWFQIWRCLGSVLKFNGQYIIYLYLEATFSHRIHLSFAFGKKDLYLTDLFLTFKSILVGFATGVTRWRATGRSDRCITVTDIASTCFSKLQCLRERHYLCVLSECGLFLFWCLVLRASCSQPLRGLMSCSSWMRVKYTVNCCRFEFHSKSPTSTYHNIPTGKRNTYTLVN